jgi:hypothetical protein
VLKKLFVVSLLALAPLSSKASELYDSGGGGGGTSSSGASVSGMANPATANFDMSGYKITNASAYETVGSTFSYLSTTFTKTGVYVNGTSASTGTLVMSLSTNSWTPDYRYTTTDLVQSQTVNYSTVTQLTHPVVALSTYIVNMYGWYSSSALTTGIGFGITAPANSTGTCSGVVQNGTQTGGSGSQFPLSVYKVNSIPIASDIVISSETNNNPANAIYGFTFNCRVITAAAGTIAPIVRTEVNGSGVTLKADTLAVYKKLGGVD